MRNLIFENARGVILDFKKHENLQYSQLEGLGDVPASIQMQHSPYQDGGTFLDTQLDVRPISFDILIRGDNDTEIAKQRAFISSVFNPKLGPGKLTYQYGDVVREIEAVAERVPVFHAGETNRSSTWQVGTIDLICPDPYWKSPVIEEEPAFKPLFKFPFTGRFQMGLQRADRIINNTGDIDLPLIIEFYGPSQSPQIENRTTGEFIKINKPLLEGETLVVNTETSTIEYVDDETGERENVFHWLDVNSTFFSLALGENDITCNCAISNQFKDFNLFYQKRYTAI